jgi:signal transduction histidine kinase
LNYAILERAGMTLNLGEHDLRQLIPAIADQVLRDSRPELCMAAEVAGDAGRVVCDGHLFDTVLKNLLYNAARFARHEVRVTFRVADGMNRLWVDDDGPGIPESERGRVFESFVQLDAGGARKRGFGLGLAIVKRAIEWHGGEVSVLTAPQGGARIFAAWPVMKVQPPSMAPA